MTPGESPTGLQVARCRHAMVRLFLQLRRSPGNLRRVSPDQAQLGLTDVQLGIVGAAFMWMYALFGPLAGWLCDRLPRKTLVLGGLIAWSLVTALTAVCHTYGQLVLCRALSGLGEAVYLPASMSLIGDYHGAATRSRAMSVHQSSVYVGSIAGGAISGLVGQFYGWRWSFILFGSCGLLFGLVVGKFLMEPPRGSKTLVRCPAPVAATFSVN